MTYSVGYLMYKMIYLLSHVLEGIRSGANYIDSLWNMYSFIEYVFVASSFGTLLLACAFIFGYSLLSAQTGDAVDGEATIEGPQIRILLGKVAIL